MTTVLELIYGREDNNIVSAEWVSEDLQVTLQDGRIILMPGAWMTWLEGRPDSVRRNFTVSAWSIDWPDVDNGMSIETFLLGRPKRRSAEKDRP